MYCEVSCGDARPERTWYGLVVGGSATRSANIRAKSMVIVQSPEPSSGSDDRLDARR